MTDLSDKLSAYLDGELGVDDAAQLEAQLAVDPALQAELDALVEAEALLGEAFDEALTDPVPLALAQKIRDTELPPAPANLPHAPSSAGWRTLVAASLACLIVGGGLGYGLKPAPAQKGWVAAVAEYHAIYAAQGRHLVEVGADEADHIETWLGNAIGTSFAIPDLADLGLTFQGGRLLTANGKPVAQLMYRLDDGTVIALCLQKSGKPAGTQTGPSNRTINGFDFVLWTADGADYVVIGPEGQAGLDAIAAQAAVEI